MMNNMPNKSSGLIEVEVNNRKNNITKGFQNVLTNRTYNTAKSMNDNEKLVFRDFLLNTGYYSRKLTKGEPSGLDKNIKNDLDNDVARILNLDIKLKGRGVEKIIIPSNIIDIYTRLEVLLELKLSGHGGTLTEASNLFDELYKRGEIQNKQQYRNAINKVSSH